MKKLIEKAKIEAQKLLKENNKNNEYFGWNLMVSIYKNGYMVSRYNNAGSPTQQCVRSYVNKDEDGLGDLWASTMLHNVTIIDWDLFADYMVMERELQVELENRI